MNLPMRPALAVAVLPLLAGAARLPAQAPVTPTPPPARNAVRANVLGAVVGIYSAEYARAVGGPFALGVGGSYAGERFREAVTFLGVGREPGWTRLAWAGATLSVYSPHRAVLTGSSVALRAGAFAERTLESLWRARPTVGASYDFSYGDGRRGHPVFGGGFGIEVVVKPERGGAALFIPIHLSSGLLF